MIGWRWMQINWWIRCPELCRSLSELQWNVPPTQMESIFQPDNDCLLFIMTPMFFILFVFFTTLSLHIIQLLVQTVWRTDSLSFMQNESCILKRSYDKWLYVRSFLLVEPCSIYYCCNIQSTCWVLGFVPTAGGSDFINQTVHTVIFYLFLLLYFYLTVV